MQFRLPTPRRFIEAAVGAAVLWTVASAGIVNGQSMVPAAPSGRPQTTAASPGAAAAPTMKIGRVNLQRFPRVDVEFSVTRGEATLNGLLLSDLGVTLSGRVPDSLSLVRAVSPSDTTVLVVVVDRNVFSSSADRSRRLLLDLANRLSPHDQLGLVRVGDSVETAVRLATPAALNRVLAERYEPVYTPALWGGVDAATQIAARMRTKHRNVLLLASLPAGDLDLARVQVASRAQSRGVPVHTVAIGAQADALSLKMLSAETQGVAHVVFGEPRANDVVSAMTPAVRSSYSLSFVVPQDLLEQRVDLHVGLRTPFAQWNSDSLEDQRSFVATQRSPVGSARSSAALDGLAMLPWLATAGAAAVLLVGLTALTYLIPQWKRARVGFAASALAITVLVIATVTFFQF